MAADATSGSGQCIAFDHITFWVSNAKQAASYYIAFLGFEPLAYKGLETGSRQFAAQAVRQNRIVFLFVSSLTADNEVFANQLRRHGDFVKDVAFAVDDLDLVLERAVAGGAVVVKQPFVEEDEDGLVRFASVATTGDVTHTFVERKSYAGLFLPGYRESGISRCLANDSHVTGLQFIDHCVSTQIERSIDSSCDWYQRSLSFHRFWSVDDVEIRTMNSSLKFVVVANNSETIKMTLLEPTAGKRKSQVQEFNEYNGGPGIQHLALHTDDIIKTVRSLRRRGLRFLDVPAAYYSSLRSRLKDARIQIQEDLEEIETEKILLDFDEKGYLLQIFTEPLQDRPTLFLEVIQRHNHTGFGAGNFKALFAAVESEQEKRGNL